MTGRTSFIGTLRRRKASVGRVVLAWFVLATASFGAAPCFAMAVSGPASAEHATSADRDHTGSHATASHDRMHAHDHSAGASEQHDQQPSTPCAHCPLSIAMAGAGSTSSHAFCSAVDDVSDAGKPGATPVALKTVLSLPIIELLPFDHGPSRARDKQRPRDAAAPSIALNLRHCVLLI
jgi:hypothetical protein